MHACVRRTGRAISLHMHAPPFAWQMMACACYQAHSAALAAIGVLQQSLASYRYRVNLVLVGHQHSFERSCPVFDGTCVEHGSGTVHVTVGTAGAGVEKCGASRLSLLVLHKHICNQNMTAKFKHYVTPTPPNRMVVSLSLCVIIARMCGQGSTRQTDTAIFQLPVRTNGVTLVWRRRSNG